MHRLKPVPPELSSLAFTELAFTTLAFTALRGTGFSLCRRLITAHHRMRAMLLIRQHALDFRKSNHRQESRKQQKRRQEQSKGPEQRAHVDIRRVKITP